MDLIYTKQVSASLGLVLLIFTPNASYAVNNLLGADIALAHVL